MKKEPCEDSDELVIDEDESTGSIPGRPTVDLGTIKPNTAAELFTKSSKSGLYSWPNLWRIWFNIQNQGQIWVFCYFFSKTFYAYSYLGLILIDSQEIDLIASF